MPNLHKEQPKIVLLKNSIAQRVARNPGLLARHENLSRTHCWYRFEDFGVDKYQIFVSYPVLGYLMYQFFPCELTRRPQHVMLYPFLQ